MINRQHCPLAALQYTGPIHIVLANMLPPNPEQLGNFILLKFVSYYRLYLPSPSIPRPRGTAKAGENSVDPARAEVNNRAVPPPTTGKLTKKQKPRIYINRFKLRIINLQDNCCYMLRILDVVEKEDSWCW